MKNEQILVVEKDEYYETMLTVLDFKTYSADYRPFLEQDQDDPNCDEKEVSSEQEANDMLEKWKQKLYSHIDGLVLEQKAIVKEFFDNKHKRLLEYLRKEESQAIESSEPVMKSVKEVLHLFDRIVVKANKNGSIWIPDIFLGYYTAKNGIQYSRSAFLGDLMFDGRDYNHNNEIEVHKYEPWMDKYVGTETPYEDWQIE